MATTIKLKNSVTTTNAPSSLAQGEVAINVTDKKVWVGNAATTPVQLLGTGSDGTFTNISVSGVASFADGTVSLPAITNIGDTNTGIFFPAADTIAFAEGGAEVARFDSSGNLGIGTTSPASKLHVYGATDSKLTLQTSSNSAFVGNISGSMEIQSADIIKFNTSGASEKMRLDTSGNVMIGTTSVDGKLNVVYPSGGNGCFFRLTNSSAANNVIVFNNTNGTVGYIQMSGSSTSYNTSSDYRLKENIAPMTSALATVSALKPVTYTWKADSSSGQGFIAHELQAVVPDCVTGEKDEVETYIDEDGIEQTRPKYQGIDTSFLVATLTAAIQELNAKVDAQALEIQALKGVA